MPPSVPHPFEDRGRYEEERGDASTPAQWGQGSGSRHWKRLCDQLHSAGMLAATDAAALALLCVALERMVTLDDPKLQARWSDKVLKLLVQMGLTPTSRGRIQPLTQKGHSAGRSTSDYLKLR